MSTKQNLLNYPTYPFLSFLNFMVKNRKPMVEIIIHTSLHFVVPFAVARAFFEDRWKQAWLVMVLTMVVDLDHLLATPIFDPARCGIGFHPLHSWPAILIYLALVAVPRLRLVALGLLIHMALDGMECVRMALVAS